MITEAASSAPAGWGPEEFLGQRVPDVGRPDDAVAVEARCRAALAGECRRLETTGRTYPYRLWAKLFVPLPDERGTVVGGMMIARDVTDQRRAERQLMASRQQLTEAQRIAHLGSWELDLETDELTISDEMARIVGLPPGTSLLIEPGVPEFVHPADRAEVLARIGRMRTDPSPFCFEHRFVRTDGVVRTVMTRGEGVVDEHGRVVRCIGTEQDITERRRADAERRRLLGRVYEAQEGQDRRLAADLHDGHVQSLAAIGFKLEQARLRLGDSGSPEVDELLWQVTKDLSTEVTSLRRTIGRLRPLVLRERVEALGGRFRVTTAPGQGTVVEARLPLTDPAEWRWGA